MTEKEAIGRLKDLIKLRKNKAGDIKFDTCICGTRDLNTVLQLLEKKEIKINRVMEKLKETIKDERYFMNGLEHKSMAFHYSNGRETLSKEILKILEE